jgi:membrane-bound lytic murein transglycosylase A
MRSVPDVNLWQWQYTIHGAQNVAGLEKTRVEISGVEGWQTDRHGDAFAAFRKSCEKLDRLSDGNPRIQALCDEARTLGAKVTNEDAKRFFEANFSFYHVHRPETGAIVTGYFEPEVAGSLVPDNVFNVPVYALPSDLVLSSPEMNLDGLPAGLTAVRRTADGFCPYYTRRDIEEGALAGRRLEIAYLADAIDAFVMQVQGSGLIRLPDRSSLRVGFTGKNGHPYTSIAKVLIERGELQPSNASLDVLLSWLRADPERGRRLMWENKSYPFFRILDDAEAQAGPHGAMGVPLTPGRSLAVDPHFHQLGLPIWVAAHDLKDEEGHPFRRLMIAQDTGSAIRGPVRGDIFCGNGAEAGRIAGKTKHLCDFYILIPN